MNEGDRRAFPGLAAAAGLLVLAFGAQYAATELWLPLVGRADVVLLSGLANLTSLTAVAALGFWASGQGPRWTPVPGAGFGFWVGIVVSAVAGTVVLGDLSTLVDWVYPMPVALATLFQSLTGGPWPFALFTLAVVAPVTEEALFRGLLLRGFARRWGRWPALTLSSALFALFHLNVWQALPAFVAGLYLGWLYLATGSLLYPMVAHAVFNGLPVVLAAAGVVVTGYNGPEGPGALGFPPWPLTVAALVTLAPGLWLTRHRSPLSPGRVSDTLTP